MEALGIHFGNNLYQNEVDYLLKHEWATCCEDILWRRTKLGLNFSDVQTLSLEKYIKSQR